MPYKDLLPESFKTKMAEDENFVLLDVRTQMEFEQGHIPGAVNIDVQGPLFQSEISELDKTKTYYVNCRSGGRSGMACQIMSQVGFTGNLYNLAGGIMAWDNHGFEVVSK